MSQIAFVVNNPDYTVADSPNFLNEAGILTQLVKNALPVDDNVALVSVAVATGTLVVSVPPTVKPTTVAGTSGASLTTHLTWVKSTDASIVVQKIVVLNGALAVLKTVYVAPADQAADIPLTAVAQTATVTAINSAGSVVSTASAAFTPAA